GGELFPGSPRSAGVVPQGDDAVAGLEELCAHSDEALEVLKKATEEVAEHVVESNIGTAVRKTFDYFPPDVRRQHLPDDIGVTPRFVEPTDESYLLLVHADLRMLWGTLLLVKHLAYFSSTLGGGAQDVQVQLPDSLGDSNRLFF